MHSLHICFYMFLVYFYHRSANIGDCMSFKLNIILVKCHWNVGEFHQNLSEISPKFHWISVLFCLFISLKFAEILVKFRWDFGEICPFLSLRFQWNLPLSFTEISVKFHWDFGENTDWNFGEISVKERGKFHQNFTEILVKFTKISLRFWWNFGEILVKFQCYFAPFFHWYFGGISLKFHRNLTEISVSIFTGDYYYNSKLACYSSM